MTTPTLHEAAMRQAIAALYGANTPAKVRNAAIEALHEALAQQATLVPQEWTNLLAYVLQDYLHNRTTPRVIDIAYTAFTLAKQPNNEDGGASDWFNDTKPKITELIAKLKKDLVEEFAAKSAPAQQGEPVARVRRGQQWDTIEYLVSPEELKHGTLLYAGAAPAPQAQQETTEHKLPYDVTVGAGTFRAGVSLETFVNSAKRWHRKAFPDYYALTPEQKEANFARLTSGAEASVQFLPSDDTEGGAL